MARDIEDFLRKAAQRRAQAQQAANQARGGPQQPIQRQRPPAPPNRDPDIVINAEVIDPQVVEQPLGNQLSEGRTSLESRLEHTDEMVDAHIHEKFDHKLGSLTQQKKPTPGAHTSDSNINRTASKLIQLIREPESLRAAILLKEVLERPEHRW